MKAASLRADQALRAVRMLRRTTERKCGLEQAWAAERVKLRPAEHRALRDVCGGTLRNLHRYDKIVSSLAPALAAEPLLRLLAATSLYEAEHVPSLRPRALNRKVLDCVSALGAERARASELIELCRAAPFGLDNLHTPASKLSLPAWLHDRLAKETPLRR